MDATDGPWRIRADDHRYPNLHGDLSARSAYNAISRDPEFGYQFLEEFQDRLYLGTDIGEIPPQDTPILPYFRKLKEERLISDDAHEKITWKNAVRLLKLEIGGDVACGE